MDHQSPSSSRAEGQEGASPPGEPPPPAEAPGLETPGSEGAEPEEAPDQPGLLSRLLGWFTTSRDEAEVSWGYIEAELGRRRLLVKVVMLHLRYIFGYLAFGFLVSAPIQMGMSQSWGDARFFKSLLLGLLCIVPMLAFYPFTIIDWGRMRIPEFKNLELALTRWAAFLAGAFVLFCIVVWVFEVGQLPEEDGVNKVRWGWTWTGWLGWACDVRVAWINLGLMFFAWVRVKFHTLLFREFYTLNPDDKELVLHVPPSQLKLDLEEPGKGKQQGVEEKERAAEAKDAEPPAAEPASPEPGAEETGEPDAPA